MPCVGPHGQPGVRARRETRIYISIRSEEPEEDPSDDGDDDFEESPIEVTHKTPAAKPKAKQARAGAFGRVTRVPGRAPASTTLRSRPAPTSNARGLHGR